jgi:hypothetical protein
MQLYDVNRVFNDRLRYVSAHDAVAEQRGEQGAF